MHPRLEPLCIAHTNALPILQNLRTVRDWVRFIASDLSRAKVAFGHGIATALDEAAYMVQWALNLPLGDLQPYWDAVLTDAERKHLWSILGIRINTRKPLSYITGEAWLQGFRFAVNENVIIPRSFIAELLDEGLSPWIENPDAPMRILDLCTGSGCLAILCAYAFPNAHIDAVDISSDALALAKINVAEHGFDENIELIESDGFKLLDGKRYNLIVCNPPYVNETTMKNLPPEYLHEPRIALAGGADGMHLITQFISDAPNHLTKKGMLVLELGNEKEHFDIRFPELNATWLDVSAGDEQVVLLDAHSLKTLKSAS